MQLQNEEEKVSIMWCAGMIMWCAGMIMWCAGMIVAYLLQPAIVPSSSPTGVSSEKHMELLEAMNLLQDELRDLQVNASHNEATIRKLS